MPSMVLMGNPGSHRGPPVASGGPQTGSNTSVSREREPYGSRKRTVRVGVAPRGSALLMKRLPKPTLQACEEGSVPPPEAVRGLAGRSEGCFQCAPAPFPYGSFPLDCPRGITGCRWPQSAARGLRLQGLLSCPRGYLNLSGMWS